MKSNWNNIDYHERIRDCELMDLRIKIARYSAEGKVIEHAIKFCEEEDYYLKKNPLFLEIKNEIDKIDIKNRDLILEYVLGESYKQRDKNIYFTNEFENKCFFAGYRQSGDRMNESDQKVILISAIYCCRTAKVPLPNLRKIEKSTSFWQNLHINRYNAQQEAIEKIARLTHMEVFFICLATCEKYMRILITTNEE